MMQTTIFDAITERDHGMHLVADKAERHHAGWSDLAYAFVTQYAMAHHEFWPWELREEFEKKGYVRPAATRAWGAVYQKAYRNKIIARGRNFKPDPYRHATDTISIVSLVCRGAA